MKAAFSGFTLSIFLAVLAIWLGEIDVSKCNERGERVCINTLSISYDFSRPAINFAYGIVEEAGLALNYKIFSRFLFTIELSLIIFIILSVTFVMIRAFLGNPLQGRRRP